MIIHFGMNIATILVNIIIAITKVVKAITIIVIINGDHQVIPSLTVEPGVVVFPLVDVETLRSPHPGAG